MTFYNIGPPQVQWPVSRADKILWEQGMGLSQVKTSKEITLWLAMQQCSGIKKFADKFEASSYHFNNLHLT